VDRLVQLRDQPAQVRRGDLDQSRLGGAGRERVEPPPEPVGQLVLVPVHEAFLGQRGQRAGDLRLLPAHQRGHLQHAEAAAARRLLPGERVEDVQVAPQPRAVGACHRRSSSLIGAICAPTIAHRALSLPL
jgi:hypothetical protein